MHSSPYHAWNWWSHPFLFKPFVPWPKHRLFSHIGGWSPIKFHRDLDCGSHFVWIPNMWWGPIPCNLTEHIREYPVVYPHKIIFHDIPIISKLDHVFVPRVYKLISYIRYKLYGGIPTPLKNMKVSWGYYSQYMEKCSKPPTSINI